MATQPAAVVLSNTDLPVVKSAILDDEKWWQFTIPKNARKITIAMDAGAATDDLLLWSFDQTLSNNDAIPDVVGTTDGTIHNLAAAGGFPYTRFFETIEISGAHNTINAPFYFYVGIYGGGDQIVSVSVA